MFKKSINKILHMKNYHFLLQEHHFKDFDQKTYYERLHPEHFFRRLAARASKNTLGTPIKKVVIKNRAYTIFAFQILSR